MHKYVGSFVGALVVGALVGALAERDEAHAKALDFSAVECTEFFKLNESITFFVLLTSFILAVEYLVPPVRLGPNSGQ